MTRLFLIRHALAAPPGDPRLPGPDLPLLPEGVAQARLLANRLQREQLSAIYTSESRRAWQTAEIIATTCDLPLHRTPDLREIDLGAWGGLTYDEVTARDPQAARWFEDPTGAAPPGGEAADAAAARVLRLFAQLASADTGPIAIVGHAGSLRLALTQALGMSLSAYWRFRLDCASLSCVDWTPQGVILNGLNDLSHLAVGPFPEVPPLPVRRERGSGGEGLSSGAEDEGNNGHITLILGGARSGKSAYAEQLASASGRPVLYVATATPGDEEMAARIAAHRAHRPRDWRTVESSEEIVPALRDHASPGDSVVLDCLTLWASNVMMRLTGDGDAPHAHWQAIEATLLDDLRALIATARERNLTLILVSNEVGMGVVPPFPLGRRFQDLLGRVNQVAAAASDTVLLMIAGIPVDLRRLADPHPPTPLPLR